MAKRTVKIITISYGALGNPDNRKIEKTIEKWMGKGYRLEKRDETKSGFTKRGKTQLTFIKE